MRLFVFGHKVPFGAAIGVLPAPRKLRASTRDREK
jgi:hypothetical protein